jgi:ABC-type anion transport system duplicated permease subunit
MTWQNVIGVLGGEALLLAAVGWLVRALVSKWIQQDTEKFKNQLAKDANVEIEQLKHALQRLALEHQVRFTKLHEKQAAVIADLYERMINLYWDSQAYVFSGTHTREGQRPEFVKIFTAWREFILFVDRLRIYLPESVCSSVEEFTKQVRRRVINVGVFSQFDSYASPDSNAEYGKQLLEAIDAFEKTLPSLRKTLETELRAMLGGDVGPRGPLTQ